MGILSAIDFNDIYIDPAHAVRQLARYEAAVGQFIKNFYECADFEIYSAPGRTEILGNHTDHQHGEVLAASINRDAIAVTRKNDTGMVRVVSGNAPLLTITEIDKREEEYGTTKALIKGVIRAIKDEGYKTGGFDAYITSDVLIGAGLSSSAAFESLIGTIVSGLYNDMKIDPVTIAKAGQFSENDYFGKPCGLMDQMACSVGNLVHIDFADPKEPIVNKIDFDFAKTGYSLCITDTKGSHSDLTADYAAIPGEMKSAANILGMDVLRTVTLDQILDNIDEIRDKAGDRAVLRAIHFLEENKRAPQGAKALEAGDFDSFLKIVRSSGNSSYKYLQNIYSDSDVKTQNISIALAVSDSILGEDEAARVHGGGFAGTIQAFVRNGNVDRYKKTMDKIFGEGSCEVLKIRKYGGMKVL